jgi:hypothetical protein
MSNLSTKSVASSELHYLVSKIFCIFAYPCELEFLVNFSQLSHLISENMTGLVPLSPEQHHYAFISASFLHFLQLLKRFDLD